MISLIAGWLAVILVTAIASAWAFWGAIEGFHEGWFAPTLAGRVLWLLPYLAPAFLLAGPGIVAIRWPAVGASLFFAMGIGILLWTQIATVHLNMVVTTTLTLVPLVIGVLWMLGSPRPRRLAYLLAAGIPAFVMIVSGARPAYRVATRIDDGNRAARVVEGNGVALVWAPAGPGWETQGNVTWDQAVDRCRRLSADGSRLLDAPQDVWRLPSIDEAVRSLTYHGQNSGGRWNPERGRATYNIEPDKESPLWDPDAGVIYWWTNTAFDAQRAWTVSYGGVCTWRA